MNQKSQIEERLCRLYLRLNGYFVNNLLIHSSYHGNLQSELDIVSVRFPYHSQPERAVESSPFLELDKQRIEILLADVKGGKELEFNKSLRGSRDSIIKLLKWIGLFEKNEVEDCAVRLSDALNEIHRNPINEFKVIDFASSVGAVRIKLTFFAMSLPRSGQNELKYIHGQEVIDYCWTCLRVTEQIDSCSRNYNYEMWGEFEDLVTYFKHPDKASAGTMLDLYSGLKA